MGGDTAGDVRIGQSRTGSAERLPGFSAHGVMGWKDYTEGGQRRALFPILGDVWMAVLQLPEFPKGQYFEWEKELWAQPRAGLAWQRVAGLFFFGCSRGNAL